VWLLGSGKDRPLTGAIAAAAPGAVDLGGRTSLAEAVDLLALARVVVSNDSGLLHVAGALGRPVVGLYGSSSPDFTPPLGARAVVLAEDLPCRPCFARECPLGHLRCLEELSPDRVVAEL
ncbi:MAG TPA: lipopolysaccharide heptosyltransferase II, partial [Gammaproteobacteria bacterium]|nr:lipopolysaccharide heptosyltransferase II [Gammaproteobacteria bacterium]